jgi:hypothetical protein
MKRENLVRRVVRQVWGNLAVWTEPTWGSSVGLPDVVLPLGRGGVAVELKDWGRFGRKGCLVAARPAQRRWHVLAAERGERSLFLALVDEGIWAFNGKYINDYSHLMGESNCFKRLGYWEDSAEILSNFNALAKDKLFWK